jgi:hypothetical protein
MPSKKQRRRRAKDRRHEYEYVYVDDEGHEVDPVEAEAVAPKERKKAAQAPAKATRQTGAKQARGAVRPVPAPNWRRVAKRGAIFAPFMFLAISLLGHKLTLQAKIIETLWLMLLFVPFSYLIDRMMYRRYLRQTGQAPTPPQRPARKPREKEKAKVSSKDD